MEIHTYKVDSQGRITLPSEWRKAHRIQTGSEVAITVSDDAPLLVQTRDQILDEARMIVARHARGEHSAVEQLLADRRREARLEEEETDQHGQSLR
jgi:AbrB family looped-hinge helix DNA binding protein